MSSINLIDSFSFKEWLFFVFGFIGVIIFKILRFIMPKTAKIFWDGVALNIKKINLEANEELFNKMQAQIKQQEEIIQKQTEMIRKQEKIISRIIN